MRDWLIALLIDWLIRLFSHKTQNKIFEDETQNKTKLKTRQNSNKRKTSVLFVLNTQLVENFNSTMQLQLHGILLSEARLCKVEKNNKLIIFLQEELKKLPTTAELLI